MHPIDREFALLRASYADEELRCQVYCERYPNVPTHPPRITAPYETPTEIRCDGGSKRGPAQDHFNSIVREKMRRDTAHWIKSLLDEGRL
jgi:hypothetical protein